jgi:hypothetical protein
MSRKVRNMLGVLSLEDFTRTTGLNIKKIDMILKKSDQVEQKLIEGAFLFDEYQFKKSIDYSYSFFNIISDS